MSPGPLTYPFSAVCGMEDAKRAIMCAAVSPGIRTVLIRGGPGTAKSVLARSAGDLLDMRVVEIPSDVSEDRLFGGIDPESSLREGRVCVSKGLLAEADGCIAVADNINLMDRRLLASMLDCVLSGRVILEREGVSSRYECRILLIATMDPNDGDIGDHLLDRFDLCAYSDEADRAEVLERSIRFSESPSKFRKEWKDEQTAVRMRISRARIILQLAQVSDELLDVSSELAARVSADGLRGDLAMARTALALAALEGRDEVNRKDVEDAAMICLAHRRSFVPPPPPGDDDAEERQGDCEDQDLGRDNPENGSGGDDDRKDGDPSDNDLSDMLEDIIFDIGERFRVIDYTRGVPPKARRTASHKGRRAPAESRDASGRQVGSRIPKKKATDIAFDATVRAAAPYQRYRDRGDLAIRIEGRDLRTKMRERNTGCTILFLVDASGSLGVRKRMSAVKGAVMSMLRDSYVKRDRVGLMAFRRDSVELILPPTRSADYGYRMLEELPTGGKTPLALAMIRASDLMISYSRSHEGEDCRIVVITDGRANVPLTEGRDANEEAINIAPDLRDPRIGWIVVDAGAGYVRFDNARRLAMGLEAAYFRLEELSAERIADNVRDATRFASTAK